MKTSSGVEAHLWGEEPITWETVNDEAVKVQPLYIHFQKLTKQCETFMAGANKMLQDAPDGPAGEDVEDTIKGASLCGEIIVARDDIERAMRVLGKDPKSFSETCEPSLRSVLDLLPSEPRIGKYALWSLDGLTPHLLCLMP